MPELSKPADIQYLKNQLALDLTELEATSRFEQEILNSLNSTWRRIDNVLHNMRRK
jgi:phosphatidylinositol-4,5-bisphosphate 3-kinase